MKIAHAFGGSYGISLMKFSLTYDGELPASANDKRRTKEKWAIREQIDPQLAYLWETHPSLKLAFSRRVISKDPNYGTVLVEDQHHTGPVPPSPTTVLNHEIDLCASIPVRGCLFRPLVRKSYALVCTLKIHFMRNGPAGNVYEGGDLDNRIKTLLDALTLPQPEQIPKSVKVPERMHVLLEDDGLVTGFSVESQRLLSRPDKLENEVRLTIDIDVRVTDARSYNTLFLGD